MDDLVCAYCMYDPLGEDHIANKAITIINGNAVCEDHLSNVALDAQREGLKRH